MTLLAALVAHLAAFAFAFSRATGAVPALGFFALQAVAAALLAIVVQPWLPEGWRAQRRASAAMIFAVDFFVPVLGLAMLAACFVIARLLPPLKPPPRFAALAPLRYATFRGHEGTAFRSGQVRGRLADQAATVDVRLAALVAVQDAPARTTGELLRDLLADPLDDLRLLAYGLLDNKEKAITQRIVRERERLKALDPKRDRTETFGTHKRIAELAWELIYQSLVQGDLLVYTAQDALTHADAALQIDPNDGGLWFLLGRIRLARDDLDLASDAFETALAHGFPRERVLPYLAELRYRQRRFSDVLMLAGELKQQRNAPILEPVLRYWKAV